MRRFVQESINKTKQRIRMCRRRDVLSLQPHLKLIVIDSVNYNLSLLSDKDRRALIHDLLEQQKVVDAKKKAEYKHQKRMMTEGVNAADKNSIAMRSEVIQ